MLRTHGPSDNVKTVYPPTNTVCRGYKYDNFRCEDHRVLQRYVNILTYLLIRETTALKQSEYSPITNPSRASMAEVWASPYLSAGLAPLKYINIH